MALAVRVTGSAGQGSACGRAGSSRRVPARDRVGRRPGPAESLVRGGCLTVRCRGAVDKSARRQRDLAFTGDEAMPYADMVIEQDGAAPQLRAMPRLSTRGLTGFQKRLGCRSTRVSRPDERLLLPSVTPRCSRCSPSTASQMWGCSCAGLRRRLRTFVVLLQDAPPRTRGAAGEGGAAVGPAAPRSAEFRHRGNQARRIAPGDGTHPERNGPAWVQPLARSRLLRQPVRPVVTSTADGSGGDAPVRARLCGFAPRPVPRSDRRPDRHRCGTSATRTLPGCGRAVRRAVRRSRGGGPHRSSC